MVLDVFQNWPWKFFKINLEVLKRNHAIGLEFFFFNNCLGPSSFEESTPLVLKFLPIWVGSLPILVLKILQKPKKKAFCISFKGLESPESLGLDSLQKSSRYWFRIFFKNRFESPSKSILKFSKETTLLVYHFFKQFQSPLRDQYSWPLKSFKFGYDILQYWSWISFKSQKKKMFGYPSKALKDLQNRSWKP